MKLVASVTDSDGDKLEVLESDEVGVCGLVGVAMNSYPLAAQAVVYLTPEKRDLLVAALQSLPPTTSVTAPPVFPAAVTGSEASVRRRAAVGIVLAEVAQELARQDEKWGEQNHPDGTGPDHTWTYTGPASSVAQRARVECNWLAAEGQVTYLDILLEEVAEAFAEDDPAQLRAELVQVAAVAAQWVAAIDRRTAGREHYPEHDAIEQDGATP